MHPKPDFSTMGGQQLVDYHNMYASKPRSSKFQTLDEGRARCEQLWAEWAKKNPSPAPKTPTEKAGLEGVLTGPAPVLTDEEFKLPIRRQICNAPEDVVRVHDEKKAVERKARVAEGTIKILAKTNLRREGTDAHRYFEAMRQHPKVEDYLAQFEDRKKARQWLWNHKRDGHVEVV